LPFYKHFAPTELWSFRKIVVLQTFCPYGAQARGLCRSANISHLRCLKIGQPRRGDMFVELRRRRKTSPVWRHNIRRSAATNTSPLRGKGNPEMQRPPRDEPEAVFFFIFSFNYSGFIETVLRPKRLASAQLGIQMSIFLPLTFPPVSETRYSPL